MNRNIKEILAITFNLAAVCFFAGLLLGAVYLGTHAAKEKNQARREAEIQMGLLGYGTGKPAPASFKMTKISRYLIQSDRTVMGYLAPTEDAIGENRLVLLEVDGRPMGILDSVVEPDAPECRERIRQVCGGGAGEIATTHVEDYQVAWVDGRVAGYLLTGATLGFKAEIRLVVALKPDFTVRGVAVVESEEDPGLGAETSEPYFRNQFVGKTADQVAVLAVATTPLPDDYRKILESDPLGNFSPEDLDKVRRTYGDDPIYAVTGATISSTAVTRGVQEIVQRFAYRLQLLEKALTAARPEPAGGAS